jgi:putative hydrolase of HD superfamily
MKAIADFFFELGMLKKTPRTGYQFLGTGSETVAEHTFRTAMIGYTLAKLARADAPRVALLCLCHDLAETRTGDHNYVNKKYVSKKEGQAVADLARGLPFADELVGLVQEYKEQESLEARLAFDADQLDLICELREQLALGNSYAALWLEHAKKRLVTETGQKLAEEIENTDPTAWWYEGNDSWWS